MESEQFKESLSTNQFPGHCDLGTGAQDRFFLLFEIVYVRNKHAQIVSAMNSLVKRN